MQGIATAGAPLHAVSAHDWASGYPMAAYQSPDGRGVTSTTNLASPPFSDDFGTPGASVDLTRWDVLPGGLGANPSGLFLPGGIAGGVLSQAAIGSGVSTGMSLSQAASQLNVVMGTAANAELWLLSRAVFAASENVTFTLSKSQCLAANSVFIGLVEVDPATGNPLLNPNAAGEFTNRGGVELGLTASTTTASAVALGDSSPAAVLAPQAGFASFTGALQEFEVEVASEDVIVSQSTVDNAAGKAPNVARASSQCPNDNRVYKLLMRFRNVTAPASSTTVTLGRVLVECKQSVRVVVDSGNGDTTYQKAIAVNIAGETNGAPLTGGGVRIMGSDGTFAHDLATDGGGRLTVTAANGAVLGADATPNTGATLIGYGGFSAPLFTMGYVFNGSTWDRLRSAANAHASTGTGLQGTGLLGYCGTYTTVANGQYGALQIDTQGHLLVTPTASPGGGGLSTSKVLSAASTNATSVKTSPGRLYGGQIANFSTSPRYLKLYNKATAPIPGTDVPVLTLVLPGAASASVPSTVSVSQALAGDLGVLFNTGIAYAVTGAVPDSDTTAIAAGDVLLNLLYV